MNKKFDRSPTENYWHTPQNLCGNYWHTPNHGYGKDSITKIARGNRATNWRVPHSALKSTMNDSRDWNNMILPYGKIMDTEFSPSKNRPPQLPQ